jgi:hypothetical protein
MKYRPRPAKKIEIDGIKFASLDEGKRYIELKEMQRFKIISSLICHPKFILQPSFKKNSKTIQAITWSADFSYFIDGERIIEDVKPWNKKRQEFIIEPAAHLRHKMFEYLYPNLTIKFVR